MRLVATVILGLIVSVTASPPDIEYIYPAGAQRGTTVSVRVGGYYFHGEANFEMLGQGVKFKPTVKPTKTIWFEGPLIQQPLSQQGENYPKDYINEITIAKKAELGHRLWRCWTSQGATKTLRFIIGDHPEVIEDEIDGRPIPQPVTLPVTANGRIFPREDVDVWTFNANAGETIVCDAAAKRFGSPLNIVLSVQDSNGNPIATEKVLREGDPIHWFKAPYDGRYEVHVHDAKFWGMQNHVYRLTLKRGPHILYHFPLGARRGTKVNVEFNGPALPSLNAEVSILNAKDDYHLASVKNWGTAKFVISEYPEYLENQKIIGSAPVVFNGRISKPGETDIWQIKLAEKQKIIFDLSAAQLGTPLDAVLTLNGANGKQLATNDDRSKGQPDPRLEFTAKKAGVYVMKIQDRFASRGGPHFAYRLTATESDIKPNFELTLIPNYLNLYRLTQPIANDAKPTGPKLKVSVDRQGGFKGEVKIVVTGLPPNVQIHNTTIAANKKDTSLQFTVPPKTKIAMHRLTIKGVGDLGDQNATRTASVPGKINHLFCGIVPAVPFKHHGVYRIITGLPGGTTYHRKYSIDRGGFDGPITVRLADKQIRHLQGIKDAIITVPKGVSDFIFPVRFPARIEVGRTSRVCIMLVGRLTDFDGSQHNISYTSRERDDQLISVAAEGLVAVKTPSNSFTATPNSELAIPVTILREPTIMNRTMKVDLLVPNHTKGISTKLATLGPEQKTVILKIQVNDCPGPFNGPLKIRARTMEGPRHEAVKEIELVSPPR